MRAPRALVKRNVPCSVHFSSPDRDKLATGIIDGTDFETLVFPVSFRDNAQSDASLEAEIFDATVSWHASWEVAF